jgi:hypothetical protein
VPLKLFPSPEEAWPTLEVDLEAGKVFMPDQPEVSFAFVPSDSDGPAMVAIRVDLEGGFYIVAQLPLVEFAEGAFRMSLFATQAEKKSQSGLILPPLKPTIVKPH